MSCITFKAPATAFDHRTDDEDGSPIDDPGLLKAYHGYLYKDECFDEHMSGINDKTLEEAGVSGGYLRFEYREDSNTLYATTEYQLRRILTDTEIKKLREYTVGQWSDGIGSNLYQIGMINDGIGLGVDCFIDDLIETLQPETDQSARSKT